MATITRTYTPATGDTILAAHLNTDLDTIYSEFNGSIDNANIKTAAAIAISKTTLVTFTDWADYTPTYSAGGAMTWGTITTHLARHCRIGRNLFVQVYASGTTGGVASNNLGFTLPVAPTYTADSLVSGGCAIKTAGTIVGGIFYYDNAGAKVVVRPYDASNWSLGANSGVNVQLFYEVT